MSNILPNSLEYYFAQLIMFIYCEFILIPPDWTVSSVCKQ